MIKQLLGTLLRKAGYQAVPTSMLRELGLVLHLKRLFQTQRIDAVFDVGANRGQFYRLLRNDAQFQGIVLSFEPIPSCIAPSANSVRPTRNGMFSPSRSARSRKLDHQRDEARRAELLPRARCRSHRALPRFEHAAAQGTGRRQASRRHLRDTLPGTCLRRPYLKIDTQGYDLNVLMGGAESLRQFVALPTEASVLALYKDMPSSAASRRSPRRRRLRVVRDVPGRQR